MKRAGVYVFYDKDGIVDRCVPYYIQELHKVVDYIVVVVNGKLTADGRRALVSAADDMFVRENIGYDSWAYKTGIEYIGWDKLREYDELVLANSSVYGPVFPFNESFDKMEEDDCNFWGYFTAYGDRQQKEWFGVPLKWGHKPESILSNFLVFKKEVLRSYEFKRFFDEFPNVSNYFEACVYFEMTLTNDLRDAGFVGRAYDQGAFRYASPSPTVHNAYDMLTSHRIPIVRKKAFFDPNGTLDYCTDIPCSLIRHIDEHTDYDCDLIWENLLRTNNLYDLKNWLNWNNILPLDYSRALPRKKRIAVIFHTWYDDIMGQYLHNIEAFPEGTDFYFTTDTEEKLAALGELLSPLKGRYHIEYRLVENRGRDMSALLVGCRDVVLEGGYDLICFMHDKKGIGNKIQFSCVGQSFSDCCFENVAASADYVNNVIDLFERQPRLGLSVPPPPKNANYYREIGGTWADNYRNTESLLKELDAKVPIDRNKPPVAPYGSVFWFRPVALRPLFEREWQYEDFAAEPMPQDGIMSNAIERACGFIAQSQGYYTSVIMNSVYAEQEVTRMTEIAHNYVDLTLQYVGPRSKLRQATEELSRKLQRQKQSEISKPKPRGPFKSFVRNICPIGLWNLLRRLRCALIGGVYIEPYVQRSLAKSMVRACTPRCIWNAMRKRRCRREGLVYEEE